MRKFLTVAGAGLAMLLGVQPAAATTVAVSVVVDLHASDLGHHGFASAGNGFLSGPVTPFALGIGDTLDYSIDFVGDQSLVVTDPWVIWGYVDVIAGESDTSVQGEGFLQLIDSDGSVIIQSNMVSSNDYFGYFGQQFTTAAFTGGLPANIAFYGLRYVGTVLAYGDPSVTSRLYSRPELVTISGVPAGVPEPTAWAMLIAGFGLTGAALRRRREVTLAA